MDAEGVETIMKKKVNSGEAVNLGRAGRKNKKRENPAFFMLLFQLA